MSFMFEKLWLLNTLMNLFFLEWKYYFCFAQLMLGKCVVEQYFNSA